MPGMCKDALEGKGPQRQPRKRLGKRLEEAAKAVGGSYCWLQMPWKLALCVRGTVAGHRLGALQGGGGGSPPSLRYTMPHPAQPQHPYHWAANTETTPAGAPAAEVDRKQQPDTTCERKNGQLSKSP